MNTGLISPKEIIPLEFGYVTPDGEWDIEGWPFPGGYDVWVIDPDGEDQEIGKVEQSNEVRPFAIDWIDEQIEKIAVGDLVQNKKSGRTALVRRIVDGRLDLWAPGRRIWGNPNNWRKVERMEL